MMILILYAIIYALRENSGAFCPSLTKLFNPQNVQQVPKVYS